MPKSTKITINLECLYTDEELATKRDALADSTLQVGKVELDKANTAKAYMVKIEVMTDSERQDEIEFDLEGNRSIEKLITEAHKPGDPQPSA